MPLPAGLAHAMRLDEKAGPIKALHIFDFDGTLVRTPGPDAGSRVYERSTGRPWPRKGWWGHSDSLCEAVVPSPVPKDTVISTVFSELEEVTLRAQTAACVVVTGRLNRLRPQMLRVLHGACETHSGSEFVRDDAVFLNPGGQATLAFKKALITELVSRGPPQLLNLEHLHIWEDRTEHARAFTDFGAELRQKYGIATSVHFVPADMP